MLMNQRKLGILLGYLNIGLSTVLGLAYVPIMLHYIGKNEYGIYQMIGSLIAYFSVMDFGLTPAVVRFYSKYKLQQDELAMENLLAVVLRVYVVIALLMAAGGCAVYYYMPQLFAASMTAAEILLAQRLFLLMMFNLVAGISTMCFKSVMEANQRFVVIKGLETLQFILQPLLVISLLHVWPSALTMAGVMTLLNVLLISLRIYYCFARLKVRIRYHYFDRVVFSEFKRLALSVFVVTLIDQVFYKTNQVILGAVSGTEAVAVYAIAAMIYSNYMNLSTAISGVFFPHVVELISKNSPVQVLSDLFIKVGRLQFFVLALVTSGFIVFGREFISMWAGSSFADAYVMTLLIILPMSFDLLQNLVLSIMMAKNTYDFRAKLYFVMGAANLALSYYLAQNYGGIGCALAMGLVLTCGNGLVINCYHKIVNRLDIGRFWRELAGCALPVAALAACAFAVDGLLERGGVWLFLLKLAVYVAGYAAAVYKFAFNDYERDLVHKLAGKICWLVRRPERGGNIT